ncbi:hypothetical protein [Pseudomonas sp. S49]|jgi:hypothetical protein|uniref:hypothetical protein n=1 Tax=Pseudomonas sp. S49 TaxID=1573720 RepID=UPI00132EEB26|nr:hypothetical protein [Pseudomonas sp. S49]QHF52610.1 hypothetical protein PspS49_24275 [Pseudomonas sp. S49]
MVDISEQELIRRLELMDEETLIFISKYSQDRRKLAKTSTLISTAIATIAGFALSVSSFFPGSNTILIGVISIVLGAVVAGLGLWERQREEMRLISQALKESAGAKNPNAERKKELIEKFLKAEGL